MKASDIFFFGKWDSGNGHVLHNPRGYCYHGDKPSDFPVREGVLDAGLLPGHLPEEQGKATFFHINGWTILAFWDRSGDKRGNSNSTFLLRGTYTFEEAKNYAKEFFPKLFERFPFELTLRFPQQEGKHE